MININIMGKNTNTGRALVIFGGPGNWQFMILREDARHRGSGKNKSRKLSHEKNTVGANYKDKKCELIK